MKRFSFTALTLSTLLFAACSAVPITGRKQVNLVSNTEVLSASLTQYRSYMSSATAVRGTKQAEMVERVGKRIATATEAYLRANGLGAEIDNYAWEFNLVKDNEVNAFCMPGGKIVVYEGILKYIHKEDDLAVVLGHEVAHAVAKHSNERMSQQLLAQYGGVALGVVLGSKSKEVQNLAAQVYGLGAQFGVMLPFSRKHETEADYMGLVLMTMAGYQPEASIGFWQRMSEGKSSAVPEIMSTHPSDESRIAALKKAIPMVKKNFQVVPSIVTTTPPTSPTKKKAPPQRKKSR